MSNVERIRYIANEPLISNLKGLFEERFYKEGKKVVKVLEVGCGPGDISLILKDALKDKVDITAIDPSDDIELAIGKSNGNDVRFLKDDIFEFKTDEKFDLVLFTKSLHHCNPVDKAVENAYNLLNERGILFAEEMRIQSASETDIAWFFDRVDLVRSAGCLASIEERLKTAGPTQKHMLTKVLDPNLSPMERWLVPKGNNSSHHHHGHGNHHQHHKAEQEHTKEHHHISAEDQKKLDREDPNKIAALSDVQTVINAKFGEGNVEHNPALQFYQFLLFFGLKDTEVGQAMLKEFMKQEKRATSESSLIYFGVNIVAYKNGKQ